ncbi:helix-turn-helix domain-containing protein, partial [Loigolactobacillus coryniformis]|uniref:helix-turn-helix domain-containing protein n=1 Tax=Loigolactobacillus coryniformis TaxID=1610 RepID=UPI00201A56E0
MTDFSKKLRVALAWRGKNDSELAQHLNITPQAVHKFTSGKGLPNSAKLVEMARFLGVSIDYLLGAEDVSGQIEDVLNNSAPR